MFVEIFILVATILLLVVYLHKKPKNIPPGEWGLPIVGYLPFMKKRLPELIKDLRKKYGDVFSLKLGSRLFVVVCDYELIKTSLTKAEFSGRPRFFTFDLFMLNYKHSITTTQGDIWYGNRKFAVHALSDFGFGKTCGVDFIMPEVEYLIDYFRANVDKPVELEWSLNVAILNVTWRLLADRRYEVQNEDLKKFSRYITENLQDIDGPMLILNYLPWLVPILPNYVKDNFLGVGEVKRRRDELFNYFMKITEEHKKHIDHDNPRDYIDKYLIELNKHDKNPLYSHFGDLDLKINLLTFFLAATDTTSSTLRWFLAYMAKNPDQQKKVQQQIDSVVPRDRFPSWSEKPNLPYLEALASEVGRFASFLPTSVPHKTTETTTLGGFTIPKGTVILPSNQSCHEDKRYWKYPDTFNIENFLDENGKYITQKEGFLPFSTGRRKCVGEVVAKMELFLFIGAILQNFEIYEPEGENISLKPIEHVNLFNYSRPYKILLKKRQ